ncbi:unnamed protein product [Calicophoron daubneyi]|uniref:C2H2-type domain-containing protein n=1 Tax=Calicophoron daubneyi TaxID=300641 RepID=A0AAV2TPJ2_CALDB
MVSDYLFCGTCFLNFRLSDISLFIEHKKTECAPADYDSLAQSKTGASLVANLLECVQCFRTFSTAWPLLMHIQFEHQLLFANALEHAKSNGIVGHDEPLRTVSTSGSTPLIELISSDPTRSGQTADDTHASEFETQPWEPTFMVDSDTQTTLSCCRAQPLRQQGLSACCLSTSATADGVGGVEQSIFTICKPESGCLHVCTCSCTPDGCPFTVSSSFYKCDCYCSQQIGSSQLPPSVESMSSRNEITPDCTGSYRVTSSCAEHTLSLTARNNVKYCVSNGANLSSSRSSKSFCCPCPPSRRQDTVSTHAQTDFDPEFSTPDYADIAMLLATPERDENFEAQFESVLNMESSSMSQQQVVSQSVDQRPGSLMESSFDQETPNGQDNHGLLESSDMAMNPDQNSVLHSVVTYTQPLGEPSAATSSDRIRNRPTRTSSLMRIPTKPEQSVFNVSTNLISGPSPSKDVHTFICSECGNTYRQKVHLRKHVLTEHIKEKPFQCPRCKYTTVEKSHLTVHIRTHTGERPFSCRECNYSSTQNCTLKSHYIRKHPASRIYCTNCSQAFYTELERSKHGRMCFIAQL